MEVAGIEPAGAEVDLSCDSSTLRRRESALPRIHNTARLVLGSLLPSDRERRSCAEALPSFGYLRAHSPDTGLAVVQDADDFESSATENARHEFGGAASGLIRDRDRGGGSGATPNGTPRLRAVFFECANALRCRFGARTQRCR